MTTIQNPDETGLVTWSDELEVYFAGTGERAFCSSWLHKRAEDLYSKRRTYIDMPVIVMSSVIGFCSVGASSLFGGHEQLASIVLGLSSLVVSVLNTTGSYFGWAKRAEGHRLSSIYYGKLFRFISVEMKLPRDERVAAPDFLKYVKDQYDRLVETSPLIPHMIIHEFKSKFNKDKYKDIAKPEETNGLEKITIIKPRIPLSKKPSRFSNSIGGTPPLIHTAPSSDEDTYISADAFEDINPMYKKPPTFPLSPASQPRRGSLPINDTMRSLGHHTSASHNTPSPRELPRIDSVMVSPNI